MSTKTVATVRQIDQPAITILHTYEGGGTEHLVLKQEGSGEVWVGLAGLSDLIEELQRLQRFYGSPNLESPVAHSRGLTRR